MQGFGQLSQLEKQKLKEEEKARHDELMNFLDEPGHDSKQGPPPDMKKRQLIFDSLSKIISSGFGKSSSRHTTTGEDRGTCVFTWGAGYHGQLGRNFKRGKKKYATVPKLVDGIDVAIRQVACGGLHTAAVTDDGKVYTWGDARAMQLGYSPYGFTHQTTPRLVDQLAPHEFIVKVACGQAHTIALTANGILYAWGLNKMGQGGMNDRQSIKVPRKIKNEHIEMIDISCGDKHSVALSRTGKVYTFGWGKHGQLGLGMPFDDALKPTLVTALDHLNATSVVCGSIHTCVVIEDGSIYCFGFGEHFYPDDEQNFFYSPTKIHFKERVVQLACGQSHIIALTDSGDVYTWGSGGYGQLGHGVPGDLNAPRLVLAGKSIAQVAAGRYHSLALTSFGVLYSWGCGENGQLGHDSDENILFPKVVEPNIGTPVGQISCGEHHTAVLTSTPWTKVDPEMEEWLHCEKEEYELKLNYLKKTNHGLFKKDLLKIQETMEMLKEHWAEEKKEADLHEEEEQQRDIKSVRRRNSLMVEVKEGRHSSRGWSDERNDEREEYEETARMSDRGGRRPRTTSGAMTSRTARMQRGGRSTTHGSMTSRAPRGRSDRYYEDEMSSSQQLPRLVQTQQGGRPGTSPQGDFMGGDMPDSSQQAWSSTGRRRGKGPRADFLKESRDMVARMKSIISETGDASNEYRLKKMIQLVFAWRKEYDTLKNQTNKKMKTLTNIKLKVKSMQKRHQNAGGNKKQSDNTLKGLEMKLSTVTIKITETEQNRKNYDLNITHLKDEELEKYYELQEMREKCSDNDAFAKKMNELKLQSLEDKDRTEQEKILFENEIKQFQDFISDQLSKFHSIANVVRARREKRELEKSLRARKMRQKVKARVDKLKAENEEKENEAGAMAQQLESVNERLRYFEKRFQQIASATGLTNPDAIINKFSLKEEIKNELSIVIQQKQNQIKQAEAQEKKLLEDMKWSRETYVENKWKDVDEQEELLRQREASTTKLEGEVNKVIEKIAFMQEGLLSVLAILPPELAPNDEDDSMYEQLGNTDINPEMCLDILAKLDDRLTVLADVVAEREKEEEDRRRKEAENQLSPEDAARASSIFNLTRKMGGSAGNAMSSMFAGGNSALQPRPPSESKDHSGYSRRAL